jgi:cardiolipin synthase A/B
VIVITIEVMMQKGSSYIPAAIGASYPMRAGNVVRPLVDGEPAFRRICEAIEAAQHSVWLTVAFIAPEFQMPEGRGSLFDVLDRAQARGLDVRVLFWRPNAALAKYEPRVFSGTPEQRAMLAARGSRFRIRWDRAFRAYAHHAKSWLIDAGRTNETAFVGGINLNPHAVASPEHVVGGHHHDLYVEVIGPSATDVHHNFVQRWNEASERTTLDGIWAHDGNDELAFPACVSPSKGASAVQIQRTIHAGAYGDGRPPPGGEAFFVAGGERSIFEQYLRAIEGARRSIYIENQSLEVEAIITALDAALRRGVAVVALVPAEPEPHLKQMRRNPEYRALFDQFAALGRYEHFALVGIAAPDARGERHAIYVHAKAMLVDDVWTTIGSCNLHANSLFGHTEMNASVWDPDAARALRVRLLAKHLDRDTAALDDVAALSLYREIARDNRRRWGAGDCNWQGLAFALDPATYGI